jgi:hypothetical protein
MTWWTKTLLLRKPTTGSVVAYTRAETCFALNPVVTVEL